MGNWLSSSSQRPPVPRHWDSAQLPALDGSLAVVTGANSGIGLETALELARKGAHVVLACRSEERGRAAEAALRAQLAAAPGAGRVEFQPLDLSSLASVRAFAQRLRATHARLDLLVNNAGVMAGPLALSADGIELQFATNHLGHFALTQQLLPLLEQSASARVVTVSSLVHRHAWRFDEDAIVRQDARRYNNYFVYADAKLCNLLFTLELDRRLRARGVANVLAVACHPGVTATSLVANTVAANEAAGGRLWSWLYRASARFPIFQTVHMGALPTLYAAAGPTVRGGDFYGPDGFLAAWGYPALETPSSLSRSETAAAKLWALSEELLGDKFDV